MTSAVAAHLGRRALRQAAALIEHHHPLGQAHHQAHVVLDQEHGDAHLVDAADQVGQRFLLQAVEAGRRFVQQQQPRLGRQGAGDGEQPLLAEGQGCGAVSSALAPRPTRLR